MIFQQASGWLIIIMKGWAENSLPTFSKHSRWLRRSVHHRFLVVLCTFSICALTLNVALWAKAMMDSPPGSFPCFKGALGMRRVVVVVEGNVSGDRSPMSNEELPNGSSTALHQAWWSWSGGCSRPMVKKLTTRQPICAAEVPLWHQAHRPSSK